MEQAGQSIRVSVGEAPIDTAKLIAEVADRGSGATVLFLGTVRDHSPGKTGVTHLEYEVYTEEVEKGIEEIVVEATARWPVIAIAVEHRSGRVELGEAFDAARYVIDELKQRAPIWKKEFWPGGAEWSPGS